MGNLWDLNKGKVYEFSDLVHFCSFLKGVVDKKRYSDSNMALQTHLESLNIPLLGIYPKPIKSESQGGVVVEHRQWRAVSPGCKKLGRRRSFD